MKLVCSNPLTKKQVRIVEWTCLLSWIFAYTFILILRDQYRKALPLELFIETYSPWQDAGWNIVSVLLVSGIAGLARQARKAIETEPGDVDDVSTGKNSEKTGVSGRSVKWSFTAIVTLMPLLSGYAAFVIHAWSTLHVAIKIAIGAAWIIYVLVIFYGSLLLRATALAPQNLNSGSSLNT